MRSIRMMLYSLGLALLTIFAFTRLSGHVVAATAPAAVTPAALSGPRAAYPIVGTAPITRALAFLDAAQRADGGFEGFTPGSSDTFTTLKVVFALNAAHLPADAITSTAGLSPLGYTAAQAYSYTHDLSGQPFPGRLGMITMAAVAGDADPRAFSAYPAGHPQAGLPIDLPAAIAATYQPATGTYSTTATGGGASSITQAYALLGLAAAQAPIPAPALTYLTSLQDADGSWGFGFGGDVDTTALAIQALIAGGAAPTDAVIQDALAFLRARQHPGATWGFDSAPSSDTTAIVIQAVAAAGFTPVGASWATAQSNPQEALAALQAADGSFGGNALGTADAIPGLAEQPMPLLGRAQRAERALAAIAAAQAADGSFAEAGVGGALDIALAFAAAGYDLDTVATTGGASALDFLASQVFTYTRNLGGTLLPTQAGKSILGIVAAGADPAAFGSGPGTPLNLVAELQGAYIAATGAYSTTATGGGAGTFTQAYAMLGLAAAQAPIPTPAISYLVSLQEADGGWGYGFGGDIDTTGLVIQALVAAGASTDDPAVVAGLAFLRAQQDALAGWGNANSTAFATQGLLAAGADLADWRRGGRSPIEALALYQKPDGPFTYTWEPGGFSNPGESDNFATRQSIPALLGVSFPIRPAGPLASYTPAARGPNPDRMVAAPAFGRWGNSIDVSVPFGSDLDGDGSATLQWRAVGATEWATAPLTRGSGVFTATLDVNDPLAYEFQVTFSDPDQVQSGATLAPTAVLTSTVQPLRLYMPVVVR